MKNNNGLSLEPWWTPNANRTQTNCWLLETLLFGQENQQLQFRSIFCNRGVYVLLYLFGGQSGCVILHFHRVKDEKWRFWKQVWPQMKAPKTSGRNTVIFFFFDQHLLTALKRIFTAFTGPSKEAPQLPFDLIIPLHSNKHILQKTLPLLSLTDGLRPRPKTIIWKY